VTTWTPTPADVRRWQGTALRALTDVIARGAAADLEPLTWRLHRGLEVVGEVETLWMTAPQAVAAWQSWTDLLEATPAASPGAPARYRARAQYPVSGWASVRVHLLLDTTYCPTDPAGTFTRSLR
jgi:hypothetical protein